MADKVPDFEHVDMASSLTAAEQLGDRISDAERQETLWQAVKTHKRIILHSTAAFGAGMGFGYDTIANGATISMPGFEIYFGGVTPEGELYVPSIWASLWTAMSYLLQAMGGFLIGFVSDSFGRKWPCVGSCMISIVGVGIEVSLIHFDQCRILHDLMNAGADDLF
mgnify:FL=1